MSEATTYDRKGGILGLFALILSLVVPGFYLYILIAAGFDVIVSTISIALFFSFEPIWLYVGIAAIVLALVLGIAAIARGSRLLGVLALVIVGITLALTAFGYFGILPAAGDALSAL